MPFPSWNAYGTADKSMASLGFYVFPSAIWDFSIVVVMFQASLIAVGGKAGTLKEWTNGEEGGGVQNLMTLRVYVRR